MSVKTSSAVKHWALETYSNKCFFRTLSSRIGGVSANTWSHRRYTSQIDLLTMIVNWSDWIAHKNYWNLHKGRYAMSWICHGTPCLLPCIYQKILQLKTNIQFNLATIVYMVQNQKKSLCLCTHLKLRFTGFKPQCSCSASSGPVWY